MLRWSSTVRISAKTYQNLFLLRASTAMSISIGITSRIGNQSYATLFHQSEGNCDAYLLAGKKACVRVFLENIHGVTVTATINGNDYLFDFKGGTQPEFEYSLPIFMQMLTTFKPK